MEYAITQFDPTNLLPLIKVKPAQLWRFRVTKKIGPVPTTLIAEAQKTCSVCRRTYGLYAFNIDKLSKDGLQNVCKKCRQKIGTLAIPKFKMGDVVAWNSQAKGRWNTKIGRVMGVVPANKNMLDYFEAAQQAIKKRDPKMLRWKKPKEGIATSRNHESYLVWGETIERDVPVNFLFWPRVKLLHLHRGS